METWKFNRNIANVLQEIFLIGLFCLWVYSMNNGVWDWRDYFLYIVFACIIWFLYGLWQEIKIMIYALGHDEFIRLTPGEIQYCLYPGQGSVPYRWIKYLDYQVKYNKYKNAVGGMVLIEYLRPGTADLQQLKWDMWRIVPHPEDWERTIQDVFQAIAAHVPESQRYTQEEYQQLGARNKNYLQIWLESMKRKVSEVTGIQDDKEINSLLWYLLCITISFSYVLYQVFVIFKQ